MSRAILFCCGSLGLGNASRLLAVAQALRRRAGGADLELTVAAAGPAARFWEAEGGRVGAELLELEPYRPAGAPAAERLSWSSFVRPRTAGVYRRNGAALARRLARGRPDLALVDSDYHALPLRRAGVPVVALGQAWDVLRRAASASAPLPRASLLVERLDLAFQRAVAGAVLAPSFAPESAAPDGVRPVPLIARDEFVRAAPSAAAAEASLVVVTGGSGIGAAPLLDYARRHGLPALGAGERPSPALDAAGRPLIDRAPAALIQGGLSSISECVARRRRMLVLPIPGHAEQLLNALEVERRGLGLRLEALEPPEALRRRLDELDGRAADWPRADGAEAAADALLQELGAAPARPDRCLSPESLA